MGADEWFKSTQTGQRNKVGSNGSPISSRSAIGAHGLEVVTHHSPLKEHLCILNVSFRNGYLVAKSQSG